MQVIPSIDLDRGRSRVVFWPGASSGVGAPTDRPERIAERFVELGARAVHVVDFDGARSGAPRNLEAVGTIASRVAVPIQLAGGLEGADRIRLAFAAGATRVVLAMSVVDEADVLAECLAVAGDWLAVGLDPRPERFATFPWKRPDPPTLGGVVDELVGRGVRRFVLSHGGTEPEGALLGELIRRHDADFLVAGGATDLAGVRRLRDLGVNGIILGQALLSGAIDFGEALEAAA
ncbi:MAG TPA: HisA/HisF-related TIM barrel protein [Candidatus Limnocylindrales bacterium]|nr:HisA/HisF-related TIM barrel protein [Candidatus Limnocylindrales bacterium]